MRFAPRFRDPPVRQILQTLLTFLQGVTIQGTPNVSESLSIGRQIALVLVELEFSTSQRR